MSDFFPYNHVIKRGIRPPVFSWTQLVAFPMTRLSSEHRAAILPETWPATGTTDRLEFSCVDSHFLVSSEKRETKKKLRETKRELL